MLIPNKLQQPLARMYTGSSWIPLNVTGSSPTSIDVNYTGSDVGVIEIGEAGTIPNTGDYRSAAFGGWNDFTRWETFNGTVWFLQLWRQMVQTVE